MTDGDGSDGQYWKDMGSKEMKEKIISDLKKVGVELFKSPMGYYTTKTKKFEGKLAIVKEVQKILLCNEISVDSAFNLGKYMKENLETNQEYFTRMKKEGKTSFEHIKSLSKELGFDMKEFHKKLNDAQQKGDEQ